jgi:DUF1680 family protein
MVEGAIAHYQATGKRNFLDIAIKYADCVCREIGDKPGQTVAVPGHQIAEMALAKLYLVTGDKKYLNQAKFFLDKRGYTTRTDEYSQAHKPVVQQDEAVGHAVRAAYMYSGMADVAALTGDTAYIHAIDKIWDNIVTKKLYITGGIGATSHGEAFGKNYELPNMSAYCETCAAIGNVYLNHRLFLLHGESKYYDVLERTLYNGLISVYLLMEEASSTLTRWSLLVSTNVSLGSVAPAVRPTSVALSPPFRDTYTPYTTTMLRKPLHGQQRRCKSEW